MNNPCQACERECPDAGCVLWKRWFIENWNENIHIDPKPKSREVFRYEHPDRVRELAPKKEEEMTAAEWMAKQMEEGCDA